MSDLDKLDKVQNFVQKWVDWAKQNTMVAGFIIAGIPAILGAGYTGITKFNEVKDMYEGYSDTSSAAFAAKRKVEALEEKDRKSTRLNSSHVALSRMPSSA